MDLPGNSEIGGIEPEWLEAGAKYDAPPKKHNKPAA